MTTVCRKQFTKYSLCNIKGTFLCNLSRGLYRNEWFTEIVPISMVIKPFFSLLSCMLGHSDVFLVIFVIVALYCSIKASNYCLHI